MHVPRNKTWSISLINSDKETTGSGSSADLPWVGLSYMSLNLTDKSFAFVCVQLHVFALEHCV